MPFSMLNVRQWKVEYFPITQERSEKFYIQVSIFIVLFVCPIKGVCQEISKLNEVSVFGVQILNRDILITYRVFDVVFCVEVFLKGKLGTSSNISLVYKKSNTTCTRKFAMNTVVL